MKIFAKRKRKSTPTGSIKKEDRTSFASDPMVEELLTLDPKEWNSKQRRMIKRYQDRKEECQGEEATPVEKDREESNSKDNDKKTIENSAEPANNGDKDDHEDSGSEDSDSDDDGDSDAEDEKETAKEDIKTTPDQPIIEKEETAASTTEEKEASDNVDGTVSSDHEVYKLLDQLNSKMKRTLSRKLDRDGPSVLAEVEEEAKKLLRLSGDDKDGKKRGVEESSKDADGSSSQSKKKRKKEADWSSLTAEERVRREEQKQKQKEAAERRDRGEDKTPGYKHALNSERRRANRRKPRWKNGTPKPAPDKPVKNEHNSSGYLHRKFE